MSISVSAQSAMSETVEKSEEKKRVNPQVRVARDLEDIIQYIADETGFQPFLIRNAAIYWGLMKLYEDISRNRIVSKGMLRGFMMGVFLHLYSQKCIECLKNLYIELFKKVSK